MSRTPKKQRGAAALPGAAQLPAVIVPLWKRCPPTCSEPCEIFHTPTLARGLSDFKLTRYLRQDPR